MTAASLLHELRDAGVALVIDGDRLRVTAPSGTLTADRRDAIARCRDELLALVGSERDALALCDLGAALGDDGPDYGLAEIVAATAPALYSPPAACFAELACSRLGPCERRVAGQPCLVSD